MSDEHHSEPTDKEYPVGRGYGHDYMRGGEVFGGYGYSEREEYEMPRGAMGDKDAPAPTAADQDTEVG
jgi:hypothetical protein